MMLLCIRSGGLSKTNPLKREKQGLPGKGAFRAGWNRD
ncbi:hypothetical protein LptCag_0570 [Leptospirillum ferriphilum]|uniref:Uncharacterized protein n=1 Tax=Leptospirillum ferriphilum TaxID=178606 RepID=A0A094X5X5_9BACT|nr:hypothetical protein LptCag_0570 [Leptospirillum ferriphilum]